MAGESRDYQHLTFVESCLVEALKVVRSLRHDAHERMITAPEIDQEPGELL